MSVRSPQEKGIDAVVFDLDGTLINTTVDFRRMRERLLKVLLDAGIPRTEINTEDTIINNVERATAFLRNNGRGEEERGLRNAVGRMMDLTEMEHVHETTPVDGAGECIRALERNGIKMGVLTRGSRAYATAAVRYAGLDVHRLSMICRDDHPEEEAKPNGVAMNRMSSLIGVPPERCLVVGDHFIDLTCARSASAQFLGVLTGSYKRAEWAAKGDPVIINSVAELPEFLGIDK
jgi:phosphoglycolate phosphatase